MSEYNIGPKLKTLRLARKLTLQAVARETGFSPALISQIENNNVSPPIATLSRIAKFFDVKIGMFFTEDEKKYKYEVVRKDERREVPPVASPAGSRHGNSCESLAPRKQNKKMEPFIITLNDTVSEYTTFSHEGEKFLFVLKGTVDIILDDECITLGEGDSIYFDATIEHRFLSRDGCEVKILSVATP